MHGGSPGRHLIPKGPAFLPERKRVPLEQMPARAAAMQNTEIRNRRKQTIVNYSEKRYIIRQEFVKKHD